MNRLPVGIFLISLLFSGTEAVAGSWTDNIKLKGDFRFRDETIDTEGEGTRHRQRIRLRLGSEAQVTGDLKVVLQLASGTEDPISANQTLGEAFSTKRIGIDLAYFDWQPAGVAGVNFVGGKMKSPFYKVGDNELIWDVDLNPEGLALKLSGGGESARVFVNMGGFPVVERKNDKDVVLYALQGGFQLNLDQDTGNLLLGLSYFDYGNTQGGPPFYNVGKSFGNTLDAAGMYLEDYNLLEAFFELGFKAGSAPMAFFFDYVDNTAAEAENRGWLAGLTLGETKTAGSWALRYNYRNLEKDAVVGALTDSDFRGAGTDAKGHEFGFDYQVAKPVKASVTYFNNRIGVEEDSYHRFQLDLNLKY